MNMNLKIAIAAGLAIAAFAVKSAGVSKKPKVNKAKGPTIGEIDRGHLHAEMMRVQRQHRC